MDAQRIGRYLWSRRVFLALLPALLILGALVHELAHALAVAAQGGTILELDVTPSLRGGSLGFGRLVHDRVAWPWLVSLAPTLMWTLIAGATLAALPRIRGRRLGEGLLVGLVLVPLVDVSFGFAGLFLGAPRTDLYRVLFGHELMAGLFMNGLFAAFGWLAWRRFHALAPDALGAGEFTALYVGLLGAPWLLVAVAG